MLGRYTTPPYALVYYHIGGGGVKQNGRSVRVTHAWGGALRHPGKARPQRRCNLSRITFLPATSNQMRRRSMPGLAHCVCSGSKEDRREREVYSPIGCVGGIIRAAREPGSCVVSFRRGGIRLFERGNKPDVEGGRGRRPDAAASNAHEDAHPHAYQDAHPHGRADEHTD